MRSKSLLFSPIFSTLCMLLVGWAFVANAAHRNYGWMFFDVLIFALNAWGAYRGFKGYLSSNWNA